MTRRDFLSTTAAAGLTPGGRPAPWYERACRWGQTNITEKDPESYDIAFWRGHWKRTRLQGVIINAGGIVAYYPSKFPLHYRAKFLNGRDLYGELCRAAHEDGLAVLARMDSNRAAGDFYRAHPDWFAHNASGEPYRAGERYVACVNSPYYEEYLTGVLTEIVERSHPEGITDNSWSGLGRDSVCYCDFCARKFRDRAGAPLPRSHDWDDPVYRQWIEWSYARRLEIWDLNNKTTKAAGGPNCLWIGMNAGTITSQAHEFRDYREICRRTPILMLDHQYRSDLAGFQQNAETGKLIHGMLGWDRLIPESMSMYMSARNWFRLSAKPAAEARMWMISGFAGGIQPWWHHIAAHHEDRRAYRTAEPVMRWHEANEQYLLKREPVAAVGVVWSQRNTDFYGRNDPDNLVDAPYRGIIQALVRARIPYIPVHADDVDRRAADVAALILPNLAAVSDSQCATIRRFVERGGGLLATGASTLYTETGNPRPDFALAELFGAHASGTRAECKWAAQHSHTYLRIADGPRHDTLRGFEETAILPFGGMLEPLRLNPGVTVPLTFIPSVPVFPPEDVWMREDRTDIPGLILRNGSNGARIAFLPADIDRRYWRGNLPDHANLLANLIRWAARGRIPLAVEGTGLIDCHLYRQPGRLLLHVVNVQAGRSPIDELVPMGPFRIRVKLPPDVAGRIVDLRVSGEKRPAAAQDGWLSFEIRSVADHELAVIG